MLGELATIIDGFEEGLQYSKFNGKNSVTIFIGAADNQSISDVADVVNKFVEEKSAELPQGVKLETWVDFTYYLDGRLTMMMDNMKSGAVLVFIMLALFLRVRLAFWVMMGLPVCFLGTLLVMPMEFVNVTINITSLFAFILVLGIVVDDAIVVLENIYRYIEKGDPPLQAALKGSKEIAFSVVMMVLVFLIVNTWFWDSIGIALEIVYRRQQWNGYLVTSLPTSKVRSAFDIKWNS